MIVTEEDYVQWVQPVEKQMMHTVWRIVQNADDAEEVFQQVLEKIWNQRRKIKIHPNPNALILKICANTTYDFVRKKNRRTNALTSLMNWFSGNQAPEQQKFLVEQDIHHEIEVAIHNLPCRQAEAVVMHLVQELPY